VILRKKHLSQLSGAWLPFMDAASEGLPLRQLLRLSLFQVSVGMATVLLLGTLNRVMIVELSVPAAVVAFMIALPVLSAPFRAMLGHRSDHHRSHIGWKRIPYLWFGSLWQMGGLAIMPFALIVLSGDQTYGPAWAGKALAGIAFLMTGIGLHMTQTAGLALACDRATAETRSKVVALLYVMFLLGMAVSSVVIGWLLRDFDQILLIRVVQGCAALTMVLNLIALWKQEKVKPMTAAEMAEVPPVFLESWRDFIKGGDAGRLLFLVAIGTMGFQMQDVLLEPYGGEILGLSVGATTWLTAANAFGALAGFILSGRWMSRGQDELRMAARGILVGIAAFTAVLFAGMTGSVALFYAGATGIGLGVGLFAVSTLAAAMALPDRSEGGKTLGSGLALGAWGAAQATAAGLAIFVGGFLRDGIGHLIAKGSLGPGLTDASSAYSIVYQIEIVLLFASLIALGPLVRVRAIDPTQKPGTARLAIAEFPT
jgi:MFS transporter, BCD family, chlorophyll transporter